VAPGDLSGRAGLFFDKDRPTAAACDQQQQFGHRGGGPLVSLGHDRFRNQRPHAFFMSEAEFELQFLSMDQIEIKTKDGITTRYRRAAGIRPLPMI
jgi:hypothetical protein